MNGSKVGGVATCIAGAAYLFLALSANWDRGGPYPTWALVAAFAIGELVVVGALAALFRPESRWLFPALFSAPTLMMAMFYTWDWVGLFFFVGIAAAIFGVGVAACGAVRVVLAARGPAP